MGPKKAGKGGKEGGGHHGKILEADKAFFELKITDLNRKLAALRADYSKIENRLVETEDAYKKLDEDRADIIAYLERTLDSRTKEIGELQAKIIEMEDQKESEIQVFRDQVDQVRREYKIMRQDLSSQLKLMVGKLNALEEFRIQRNDLMQKYEQQERRMREMEDNQKRELYEAERKFIIGKDTLKKEMENRLVLLSNDFKRATEMRIAATTHRVIRDNIALNNEFEAMFSTLRILEKENTTLKKKDATLSLSVNILENVKNTATAKSNVQESIISKLAGSHEKMVTKLANYMRIEEAMQEKVDELNKVNQDVKELSLYIRKLQQLIHLIKCDKYNSDTELENTLLEKNRLQDIIYNATMTIHQLMTHKKIHKPRSRLREILQILERIDEERPARAYSLSTIESDLDAIRDLSYAELPKVKPFKYIRNVIDTTTSITSSLAEMPPFQRKTEFELEDEVPEAEKEIEEEEEEEEEEAMEEETTESDVLSILDVTLSPTQLGAVDYSVGEEGLDEMLYKPAYAEGDFESLSMMSESNETASVSIAVTEQSVKSDN